MRILVVITLILFSVFLSGTVPVMVDAVNSLSIYINELENADILGNPIAYQVSGTEINAVPVPCHSLAFGFRFDWAGRDQ